MSGRAFVLGLALVSAATAARGQDVLVIRDGTRRTGAVSGCRDDGCTLNGKKVARGLIAWVGLARGDADPPAARDPLKDEVHLVEGRVVTGEFEALSLGGVAIGEQSFEREDVAWIRFAGPEPAPTSAAPRDPRYVISPRPSAPPGAPPGASPGPPPTPPPPSPGPSPPPSPGPSPAPSPRPSASPRPSPPPPGTAVRPCPADAPLGGHIVQRHLHHNIAEECSGTAELWFDLVPSAMAAGWPQVLGASFEPTEIGYRLQIDGCRSLPGSGSTRCTAAAAQASGTRRVARPERLGVGFSPIEPSLRFNTLPEEIQGGLNAPFHCIGPYSSWTDRGWTLPVGGAIFPEAVLDVGTHPVASTACWPEPSAAVQRDCHLHPDRYAVIPFRGEQAWHRQAPGSETFMEGSTRWDVCCGCGRPPSGPPPEFEPRDDDPCADAEARQAELMRAMRTAREQVAFAERDLTCAQQRHDAAIAARYGGSGPYAQFFAALGGFAAEFQPGAGGDFFGLLFALTALAQEPNAESVNDTALEAATTDYFQELARDGQVRAALTEMVREYDRTGNATAAITRFRARVTEISGGAELRGKAIKALTVYLALKSLYEKASQVCDLWSLEQAWQRALWDADNEKTAADQRWNEGDVALQTLRRRCPGLVPTTLPAFEQPPWLCPEAPPGGVAGCGIMSSSAPRGEARPTVLWAAFAPPLPVAAAPARPADATATSLVQVAEALRRLEAPLAEIVPLLMIVSSDRGVAVPGAVVAAASAEATRVGEAARADALRVVDLARRLEPALRARGEGRPPG